MAAREEPATPSKVKALAKEYDDRATEAEGHAQRLRIRGRTPEEIQLKRLEAKLFREAAEKVRGLITPPRAPDVEWCPMNERNHTLHELIDERLRGGKYECRLCHWEPRVEE